MPSDSDEEQDIFDLSARMKKNPQKQRNKPSKRLKTSNVIKPKEDVKLDHEAHSEYRQIPPDFDNIIINSDSDR